MSSKPADADTKPAADTRGPDKVPGSSSLSQVLGKVLEQLSVSAWLPAAMLVGNTAVLLQLRADHSYNIARAVKDLAGKPLGTVIVLVFAVVLATVVMQAFEFEAIRLMEGYFDSTHSTIQAVMETRIRRHERKRRKLISQLTKANDYACEKAVGEMRNYSYEPDVLDFLLNGPGDDVKHASDEVARVAGATDWRPHAPSAALYRIDVITARLASYPQNHRLLPTRLGNILRAAEDKIDLESSENIQGFVVRNYDQLSPALKSEHRDYRTRLDMYCCLVLVFSALAAISAISLNHISPGWGTAVAVAAYGLMAYVSYEAAIASARSYGLILQEISQYLDRLDETAEGDTPSTLAKLLTLLHRKAV